MAISFNMKKNVTKNNIIARKKGTVINLHKNKFIFNLKQILL